MPGTEVCPDGSCARPARPAARLQVAPAPRPGKVWQWAATKQILWMWDLKVGLLGSSLFYLPILTDKRGRSLYDDWADLYVVQPARSPKA